MSRAGRRARFRLEARHLLDGIVASLLGAFAFGILLTAMDLMPMVAALVGADTLAVGWMVHLAVAALFGVPLAVLLANLHWPRFAVGMLWGGIAWVGGGVVAMPLLVDTTGVDPTFTTPWLLLLGHAIYGIIAGLAAWALGRTNPAARRSPPGRGSRDAARRAH